MKITKTGPEGLKLITTSEGWSAKPYICAGGICTIGYGNTYYENGDKIKMTDKAITKERGMELFKWSLGVYEKAVDSFTVDTINQNQFDALVSICYNIGANALKGSTLIRRVNANLNDPTIAAAFGMWNKANSKVLKGLTTRRAKEAALFFKK